MRIKILAISGALAASTLLAAPATADEPTAAPGTLLPAPAPTATAPTLTAPTPTAPTPTAPTPTVEFLNSCNPAVAALPAAVEGNPAVQPGAVDGVAGLGVYVWHETRGWRVRLTHNLARVDVNGVSRPQLVEVRGQITTSRPVANVRTVRLEDKQAGEWVAVHRPKRKVMDFRFVNGGFIDGINFTAGCAGRVGLTVWQVNRDANGNVTGRTPLPVIVGAARTQVTTSTIPALAPSAADRARVVITRAPVS